MKTMKSMIQRLRAAVALTALLVLFCCGVYPVLVWGMAQWIWKDQANGSLLVASDGHVLGSRLLGQRFTGTHYFQSCPSAAGVGYDAMNSGGSNLGPTSQRLNNELQERIRVYRQVNQLSDAVPIPADAVTASASGLDPHISHKNAELQAARIARLRGLRLEELLKLVEQHTEYQQWSWLGEPSVRVLTLNLALDGLTRSQ